jgi:hypothetical protein
VSATQSHVERAQQGVHRFISSPRPQFFPPGHSCTLELRRNLF